jgi:hypothetical protein
LLLKNLEIQENNSQIEELINFCVHDEKEILRELLDTYQKTG